MRRTAALAVFALVFVACSSNSVATTLPATTVPPNTSSTTAATSTTSLTTTSLPATTVTTTTVTTTTVTTPPPGAVHVPFTSTLSLDIYGSGGPTVVLFHGGGWVTGSPADIAPLAEAIAQRSAVVFNAPYRLTFEGGGFPMTFEDAACAVRFAAAHTAEYGGDPDRLIVVGYSAGAQIAAVVALAGDTFDGDCLVEMNDTLPTRLVGLAGPYNTDALGPLLEPFFGTDPAVDPEPWRLGNPLTYLGRNPDLVVRLIHGDQDQIVPLVFSQYFEQQLSDHGYDVTLTVVPGADHGDIADPAAYGGLAVDAAVG
ncbi:carboxylesterase NlhH [bacterium BMS3Abin02]|nr:carboxylesterase NlhH [bacterium BMS3Abin02]GBE22432.1 carboxylesterase NlhH [bacterium BMS3Bbin01]